MFYLWYIGVVVATFYFICRIFFSEIRSRTITYIVCYGVALWVFCTIFGFLLDFFFEPDTFFSKIGNDPNVTVGTLTNSLLAGDDIGFWRVFLVPYTGAFDIAKFAVSAVIYHFTIPMFIAYLVWLEIISMNIKNAWLANRLRDPSQGF